MTFNSLEEIGKHFSLENQDAEQIKKSLKRIRKNLHPDKYDGENFKNKDDERLYYEITAAQEFLKKKKNEIVVQTQNGQVSNFVKQKVIDKKIQEYSQNINKKSSELSESINNSISQYHKRYNSPKITTVALTTIITALWIFPNIVKGHPFLSFIYEYNREFSVIWILVLILISILWMKVNSKETKDKEIKQSYKVETTQNQIFSHFAKWIQIDINKRKYSEDYSSVTINFSKDDLINFLLTRYNILEKKLKEKHIRFDRDYDTEIRKLEEDRYFEHYALRKKKSPFYPLNTIFPDPGEIDLEMAQLIADLIIERLLKREVLKKIPTQALSDVYEIEI